MLKAAILLALVIIVALPIVASQYLPWWGTLILMAAEVALLASLGPRLIAFAIKQYLLGLFKRKSAVLRNAAAQVHAVQIAPAPQDASEDPDHPLRYVEVDFTLTPAPGAGPMHYYDPSDLLLVPAGATVNMNQDPTAEDLVAGVHQVRLVEEAGAEVEVEKLTSPARLKVTFACPTDFVGRAKMRYYFEEFGHLELPAPN